MLDNKLLISVIVPMYNVSCYIERLVDSLASQKQEIMEVIFVNDGSTDNTLSKLEEKLKENKICSFKIINKINGGLSDARNIGLRHSSCNYVSFLDPDDYVSENYYLNIIVQMQDTDSDIGISSFAEVWPNKVTKIREFGSSTHEIKNSDLSWLLSYGWSACTKVFSRKVFDNNKFDVGLRYEDLALVPYLVSLSTNLCVCKEAVYYYCRRDDSITRSIDVDKEKDILVALDVVTKRLMLGNHQVLIGKLLTKVLVLSCIPNITLRYNSRISSYFCLIVRDFLHAKRNYLNGSGVEGILAKLFIRFPRSSRWLITLLYLVAKKLKN